MAECIFGYLLSIALTGVLHSENGKYRNFWHEQSVVIAKIEDIEKDGGSHLLTLQIIATMSALMVSGESGLIGILSSLTDDRQYMARTTLR